MRAALLELVAVLRAAVVGAAVREHERGAAALGRLAVGHEDVHQQRARAGRRAAVADRALAVAEVALDADR